jgi:adenine deaminase
MSSFTISGNLVDIHSKKIFPAEIKIKDNKIISIKEIQDSSLATHHYILPGFIDSHVHIESSMLVPSEFARLAVVHGTVATVSDPHEIANVCGMKGVEFMIENGKTVPFKFNFGAPSCVPATTFETAGASLDSNDVDKLLQRDEIKYLSEMMNFPGVLHQDEEVMKKLAAAHRLNKPVDGHAPGLRGTLAKQYIDSGISTDHECFTAEEALNKLKYGMKILIREGSAAKNFEALADLLNDHSDNIMLCSDDKHPDSLVLGHINQLCARAVAKGIDVFKVLKAACINPVLHYKLDVGLLREGDPADFIVVKDLSAFDVIKTYINGELVAENQLSKIRPSKAGVVNNFSCDKKAVADFSVPVPAGNSPITIPVIEALDGQLITNRFMGTPAVKNGNLVSDTAKDILKIVVVNRYSNAPVAKAFIKNFGLKRGALASSVAHDSHNIVAVGVDDETICQAVNLLIDCKGGVSYADTKTELVVALPVAGLMSNEDGYKVADLYSTIDKAAKEAGSTLGSPYMTLSFMALLVIPHLKLSDLGLFDGDKFEFVNFYNTMKYIPAILFLSMLQACNQSDVKVVNVTIDSTDSTPTGDTVKRDVVIPGDSVIAQNKIPQSDIIHFSASDSILLDIAGKILVAIKSKNYHLLATYVHPGVGVRFTAYTSVDTTDDAVLSAAQLINPATLSRKVMWGAFGTEDSSGKMTIRDYFNKFVYDVDFLHAPLKSVNQFHNAGTDLNNVKDAYPGADVVEFHFPGLIQNTRG